MDYYQPFLLLLDSKMVYGGDNLSVKSDAFYERQTSKSKETADLYKMIPFILKKTRSKK